MPFGIQPIHILIIIIVALLIFGPKKLPEMGRNIGKMLSEFRSASKEMTDNFRQEASQPASQTISPTIATPPASIPTASGSTPGASAIPSPDGEKLPSPAAPAASTAPAGRFCIQCGAPNPVAAHFCGNCGSKLPEQVG
jgi:TatA/E family protein of Tat protein translocase